MVQITRRDLLVGAAASGLAIPGVATAQSTDTIKMAVGAAQVVTIDPMRLNQGIDNWAITNVHDLLARAPNGDFANTSADFLPELATAWEASPDGKTWSFKLRQGVQFHKGYGECTSEDVQFSFDRLRDPKSGSVYSAVFANLAEVQTDGPYTVHFRLKQPDPFFLASSIDQIGAHIVCRKAVLERGEKYGRDPIGTGPYQLANVQPKVVSLVGNDKYFTGAPKVPKVEIQYILDSSARTLALLGGSVDTILAPSGPGALPIIMARDPKLIADVVLPGNIWTLHFNLTRKPFDDLKVRQAFMYAIDREKIGKSQTPPTPKRWGMLPEPFPGALTAQTTPPELRYDYDPDKAKALLKQAGFPNGFAFTDFTSQRDDYLSLMLVVQEQLRQVGVNFDLKAIDHAAFHDQATKGLGSFTMRGTLYPPVPVRPFLEELSSAADVTATKGQNYAHYGTAIPGIDDLLAKTMAEPDPAKNLALCQEMDRRVLTDLPVIPLCTTAYVYIHHPRLKLPFTVRAGTGFWRLNGATLSA